jgi:hypothetical protein
MERRREEIRYFTGQTVRVIAQDSETEGSAQIGDVGTVIGHEDSEQCVKVQFAGFTDWLWNDEVEPVAADREHAGANA